MNEKLLNERSKMNRKFAKACGRLKKNRDEYRARLQAIQIDYEESNKMIHNNYLPNSPKMASAIYDLNYRIKTAKIGARDDAAAGVLDVLEELIQNETSQVSNMPVGGNFLATLREISKLGITQREFDILVEKYSSAGYWVQKSLSKIASENGFPCDLDVSLDKRIEILTEIAGNYRKFLDEIEESDSVVGRKDGSYYNLVASVSDDVLNRAVRLYAQGGNDPLKSDAHAIASLLASVKTAPSAFEAAISLRNGFKALTDNARTELICVIAAQKGRLGQVDPSILKLAELDNIVEDAVKNGTVRQYFSARLAFDDFERQGDNMDYVVLSQRIAERAENKMFMDMVRSRATRDQKYADALAQLGMTVDDKVEKDNEKEVIEDEGYEEVEQ